MINQPFPAAKLGIRTAEPHSKATHELATAFLKVDWAFPLCVLLNLAPLLYFRYIPSNDGPSHVYNAALLRSFFLSSHSPARDIFVWNSSFPPNLLTHFLLALTLPFSTPVIAERLLVIGYAVLLPISFRYFLHSISSASYGLEYLSLVLVYNSHLHWGFYNFLYSMILFLLAAGYWLRNRGRMHIASATILALLTTALYLSHPVGLFEFWIVCFIVAGFEWVNSRGPATRLVWLAVASSISFGLYLHYALTRVSGANESTSWPTVRYAASLLLTFSPLATYSIIQRLVAIAVLLLLLCSVVFAVKKSSITGSISGYFIAFVITAGIVFIAPTSTGGGTMLTPRLVYFPVIMLCAWLTSLSWKLDPRRLVAAVAVLLAFAMIASNWPVYGRYNKEMRSFLETASTWPRDTYIVFHAAGAPSTLTLNGNGSPHLSGAAAGYIAADRNQILVGDYEGLVNYFPLVYKTEKNPDYYLVSDQNGRCPATDQAVDVSRYASSTAVPLRSALVLVQDRPAVPSECMESQPHLLAQADSFSLLYYEYPAGRTGH